MLHSIQNAIITHKKALLISGSILCAKLLCKFIHKVRHQKVEDLLKKYDNIVYDEKTLKTEIESLLQQKSQKYDQKEHYIKMLSLLDYTSLNTVDSDEKIISMCTKLNEYSNNFKDLPNVAAICVYPSFANVVKKHLKAKDVDIACVSAGFPSSQTYICVKCIETFLAVFYGASEIDIVISVGKFLKKDYQTVYDEIKKIKCSMKWSHAKLKVILETGDITDLNAIRIASLIAMEAGADFIKTSTGKEKVGATPEAIYIMSQAIKEFNAKNHKTIGIKPAGGVRTDKEALQLYTIIIEILGDQYSNKKLFRIGASSLANSLLTKIMGGELKYFD